MSRWLSIVGLVLGLASCSSGEDGAELDRGEQLTSKVGVERELTIRGLVYVDLNAADSAITSAVQRQIRTAFGPLRIGQISVDDREFRSNISASSYVKTPVEVIRQGAAGTPPTVIKKAQLVAYTYQARALVASALAGQTSFSLALLMGEYQSVVPQIIKDCVEDYEHDQDFASSFWYVWAPNIASCQKLINEERLLLDQERQGLEAGQIGEKEYGRRYLPLKAELKPAAAPPTTYPEYDQLYGIGTPKSRVVVYQVLGVASHDGDPENQRFENDMGFTEAFKMIKVLADSFKGLRVAQDSACNPLSFVWKNKTYVATFAQLHGWVVNRSGFPTEVGAEQASFRRAIHDHILLKWIKLEVPLEVTGGGATKRVTLEIRLIFGTESSWSVRGYFQEAFKNADVVLYDGHSYIGSGPLDPANYSAQDFSTGYQIFFFNSCVSFNYYGVSYFKLKSGQSKKLDLVTNGLEVNILDGGKSMGQFIAALFDGKQSTWLRLLERTQVSSSWWGVHDPNRNVDGELDNTYSPAATPITVKEAPATPTLSVENTTVACGGTTSGTVELRASASGAVRVDFLAGGAKVGSASAAPYLASWDTRSVADGTVQLIARAYDAAGASVDSSCSVQVKNGGGADLYFDDMESSAAAWSASGLWHLTKSGSCASPAYASATSAWYFGQDTTCNYKTAGAAKGSLTSPPVANLGAASTLSFQHLRQVEKSSSGSYDKTVVEITVEGTGTWKPIWSLDSKTASTKVWSSSGALSLAEYAGKTIRIRFTFDSVDGYSNELVGWMIDDVRVTR